jgi:FixJ family two-component response regulator
LWGTPSDPQRATFQVILPDCGWHAPMSAEKPVVFIVDDDRSMCEALERLLGTVGLKAHTFGSAREFISTRRPDVPSCLVLDVRLPGLSGLDLQRRLVDMGPPMPIVIITAYADIPMTVEAVKAGAVEFLTKPFRDQELLDAVQEAIDRDRTLRLERAEVTELRQTYGSLTQREREVMTLVVTGLLNKQVAARLGTSEATVKAHRGQLMQKMRVESLAQLVRVAGRLGLLPPPD